LQSVQKAGMYAIVHFMGLDVFGEPPPGLKLYGNAQHNFYQDEDCVLIRGWSKYTPDIEKSLRHGHNTTPVLAITNFETFQRTLNAVEDHGSAYLNSWLFVPEKK